MPILRMPLLPWTVVLVVGGVLLYVNGFDPTGSVLALTGMLGVAVTTIRTRWHGTLGRLGGRIGILRDRLRRR